MFSDVVKFLVEQAGYSERQLAAEIGLSQPSINRIRNGRQRNVSYECGARLMRLYDAARGATTEAANAE